MKLKYQLRGLGIGLIITTIILTISNNVRRLESESIRNNKPQETTGSVLAFDKDATKDSTGKEETSDKESQSKEESATEESKPNPTQEQPKETQEQPKQTQEEPTSQIVTVRIKDVYYANKAADIVYDAGLITDKKEFVAYLAANGYAEKIQEGVYNISKGASYEMIAKTICRIKS